jgi:serine/threonine-protein kinase
MLTGRPPFRAASAAETQRQVISEDPALPSRLNVNVPRDLETICLKCLSKDPSRRYATAAELAEDLQYFPRGEPISARRPGSVERIGKWIKRRPSVAALIAASALFTAIVITGMVWITIQQSNRRRAIETDLRDINQLQGQSKWNDAGTVLQRAEALVEEGGVGDLRERVTQARRNHNLVVDLDHIQLNRLTSAGDFAYYKSKADKEYLQAFKESGLANEGQPAHDVAARVNASAVRTALMQALDDWAVCAADEHQRDWLLEIARTADHDSSGWGDRIRDSEKWNDLKAISDLAENVPIS